MYTNNLEIIVNAPVHKVWDAITDINKINKWLKNVKVQTDWKEGSPILYTSYDNSGRILTLNGKRLIWDGIIERIHEPKELVTVFPSKAIGLEKESYHLVEVYPEVTRISFNQEYLGDELKEEYKQGSAELLQHLKDYLEAWY
jgi:uncharacterized protein YndB with AHSA1/START domain